MNSNIIQNKISFQENTIENNECNNNIIEVYADEASEILTAYEEVFIFLK